jgi:hypothetical protein
MSLTERISLNLSSFFSSVKFVVSVHIITSIVDCDNVWDPGHFEFRIDNKMFRFEVQHSKSMRGIHVCYPSQEVFLPRIAANSNSLDAWLVLHGDQAFVPQVIKLISQVIADFANGEISQATALFDTELTIEQYLDKSFFKTASLVAASCRSAAVFSDCDEAVKQAMFDYGKHLGLAFQVRNAIPTLVRDYSEVFYTV